MRILVTGAGAVLGQGILRSLEKIDNNLLEIHSADPDFRSTGHWLADKAHIIPFANDPKYLDEVIKILIREQIDIVMIGTDTELPIFAKNKARIEDMFKVKIIVSNIDVIDIANDKWKTAEFLREHGFAYPESVMASDYVGLSRFASKHSYPYFAKPVDGARSKGIVVIRSEVDLQNVKQQPLNLVVQEYLSEEEGEFTSGCVVLNGKCRAVVTLRRDLRDGNTYRAYYRKEYSKYDQFICSVSEKLGVEGPCNFQFRIRNGEPVIFEINARFSGTTPIRFMFGFNEVEAILNYNISGIEPSVPNLKEGMVMRAWSDLFVDEQALDRFSMEKTLDQPTAIFHPFKITNA